MSQRSKSADFSAVEREKEDDRFISSSQQCQHHPAKVTSTTQQEANGSDRTTDEISFGGKLRIIICAQVLAKTSQQRFLLDRRLLKDDLSAPSIQ